MKTFEVILAGFLCVANMGSAAVMLLLMPPGNGGTVVASINLLAAICLGFWVGYHLLTK
jgi:hypothetical protein